MTPAPALPPTDAFASDAFVDVDDTLDATLRTRFGLDDRRDGKVRVSYRIDDDHRLMITTDRISALDRVVGAVPYKGQVLTELSAHWFAQMADVIPHHLVAVPDPNVMVVRAATPLLVEVVMRGYLTGITSTSLWTRYAAGARHIDGYDLPEGLTKNAPLPRPLLTPTTKAPAGDHDEPISVSEVVNRGLVEADVWEQVIAAAAALFDRGTALAAAAGIILVDTKYEFGLDAEGRLMLIDEVHTPDSSRLWLAASYAERVGAGREPDALDKEDTRRVAVELGPDEMLPADAVAAASERYVEAYERLTGRTFTPGATPVADRIARLENLWDTP